MPSTAENRAEIGVIGGSGFNELAGLKDTRRIRLDTPFGQPSDAIMVGTLRGRAVAFLARHGHRHHMAPGEVPARPNMYALKMLGVRQVVSVSAVGSLREDYQPGDVVIPDQIVDWTSGQRPSSFFGRGIVVHVAAADPYCERMRQALIEAAAREGGRVHGSGTYVCIEGPRFSTRAESELLRSLKMDLVGMTAVPEAGLAREAELCYAAIALVTDYDCWHPGARSVDADLVAEVMTRNVAAAHAIVAALVGTLPAVPQCPCQEALARSIITARDAVPRTVRDELRLLVGKYFDG